MLKLIIVEKTPDILLIALNAFSHGWDPKRQGKKFLSHLRLELRRDIRKIINACAFNSMQQYAFDVIKLFCKV